MTFISSRMLTLILPKASWVDDHLMELIQPINLRAPEVVLGAEWDTSADIWNAGCVVGSPFSGLAFLYPHIL